MDLIDTADTYLIDDASWKDQEGGQFGCEWSVQIAEEDEPTPPPAVYVCGTGVGVRARVIYNSSPDAGQILNAVYAFQERNEIRAGISYIFSTMNEILGDGDIQKAERILDSIDVARIKTDLLLSFLTITFAARHKLPQSRTAYYARAKRQIRKDVGWLESRRLLSALG